MNFTFTFMQWEDLKTAINKEIESVIRAHCEDSETTLPEPYCSISHFLHSTIGNLEKWVAEERDKAILLSGLLLVLDDKHPSSPLNNLDIHFKGMIGIEETNPMNNEDTYYCIKILINFFADLGCINGHFNQGFKKEIPYSDEDRKIFGEVWCHAKSFVVKKENEKIMARMMEVSATPEPAAPFSFIATLKDIKRCFFAGQVDGRSAQPAAAGPAHSS